MSLLYSVVVSRCVPEGVTVPEYHILERQVHQGQEELVRVAPLGQRPDEEGL